MLAVVSVIVAASLPVAASHSVIIANSANITQCLGLTRLQMVMVDCITHIGTEFNWTVETASKGGPLEAFSLIPDPVFGDTQCIDEELKIRNCSGAPSWRWNPDTLQLELTSKGKKWCLGLIGKELLMEKCHKLAGTTTDDQNGYGAPAEQTWVLFPTLRPQISILDRLSFPLRAVGRHIIDAEGLRVKLTGLNWLGTHMAQLVNNGLDRAPLERIVKTVKYMGFNSVRLNYASAMAAVGTNGTRPKVPDESLLKANPDLMNRSALEVFDKVVEAITNEGLLVVICRHMLEPGWCCRGDDGSELWYGKNRSTEDWMDDLTFMAKRYRHNPRVIGVDIFNEPRMRDSDNTIPWWGAPTWLAHAVGLSIADWRVAAARGAVAVWRGNPDALVIVQGQLYASNLEHVMDRPMKLSQSCLQSRVVYSSHEYFWHWKIDKFFTHLVDTFRPFTFTAELKKTLQQATQVGDEDEFGSTPSFAEVGRRVHADFSRKYNDGVGLISYEEWSATRDRAVFYLEDGDKAPVWVSEFGTSRKADNAWWEYVLRYFKEKDVSWCYWPMDPIAVPKDFEGVNDTFKTETYGLFDTSRYDYSAVVGWKLQDLISIMEPSKDLPRKLKPPDECAFELESNLARSTEETGSFEFVSTMSWNPQADVDALCIFFVFLLIPVICCIGCYLLFMRRREGARSEAGKQDRQYEPLVSTNTPSTYFRSGLGMGMGSMMGGSFKTRVNGGRGSVIDAQPLRAPYDPRDDEERAQRGFFTCCTSKRPSRRSSAWVASTQAVPATARQVP